MEDLSAILRASLTHGSLPLRPFREELSLVRAYAGVEQRRLGPRLAMRWEIVAPHPLPAIGVTAAIAAAANWLAVSGKAAC